MNTKQTKIIVHHDEIRQCWTTGVY